MFTVNRRSKTIGFRLPAAESAALLERASKAGLSPGDLARQFVVDRLTERTDAQIEELRKRLLQIEGGMHDLRESLATSVHAILATIQELHPHSSQQTPQEIEEWVNRNLRPPS